MLAVPALLIRKGHSLQDVWKRCEGSKAVSCGIYRRRALRGEGRAIAKTLRQRVPGRWFKKEQRDQFPRSGSPRKQRLGAPGCLLGSTLGINLWERRGGRGGRPCGR